MNVGETLACCQIVGYRSQKLFHDWDICFTPRTYDNLTRDGIADVATRSLVNVNLSYFDSIHPLRSDHLKSFIAFNISPFAI